MDAAAAEPATADVLIVDDEEMVAYTLGEILAAEGYRVSRATSVDEALRTIEGQQFDAAVLDLNIGTESGLTVLARLREHSPHTAALILTGFGSLDTAIQAMRSGAFDYLIKPCDVAELKAALARGIEQRQRERLAEDSAKARAELERALVAAERARDDFLTIAGHELKTPLAALIGWAQLTQRQLQRGASEGAIERLESVVQQAQRMARLVEAFAELASIQGGARPLAPKTFDLRPRVERAVQEIRRRAPSHEFRVALPEEPVTVLADAGSVDLVLGSLLDNAVKFSPRGGAVAITLSTGGGFARLAVADEGVGIAAEDVERIFERFVQADGNAMSRRFGGIGAGLYLSRALLEAQGGRIAADSEGHERGSTFTVTLPLAGSSAPSAVPSPTA